MSSNTVLVPCYDGQLEAVDPTGSGTITQGKNTMPTQICLVGNEGFRVDDHGTTIFVDALYTPIPGVAGRPALHPEAITKADLLLFTHGHLDHFDPAATIRVALTTGSVIVGPAPVIAALRGSVPAEHLVSLEPQEGFSGRSHRTVTLPFASVTAFRTWHASHHNSYLVEMEGLRFFHDGDNEDTRPIIAESLGALDALMIGPWFGSGWVDLVERLAARYTFLMHLTEEELRAHEEGTFLPEICEKVPPGIIVLAPGESRVLT